MSKSLKIDVVLELTEAEARALATMMLSGIMWDRSPVGVAAMQIYYALRRAGVETLPDVRRGIYATF